MSFLDPVKMLGAMGVDARAITQTVANFLGEWAGFKAAFARMIAERNARDAALDAKLDRILALLEPDTATDIAPDEPPRLMLIEGISK